jgi:hypothetical protein
MVFIGTLAILVPTFAQSDGIRLRNLWNEAFVQQRPQPPQQTTATPQSSAALKSLGNSFVGMTLWRMRPSREADGVRFRGLVHPQDPAGRADWTPERVTFDRPVRIGDFVRLTIEVARRGYLYVIDSDVYADGKKNQPTLVFPTKRLRGGDNRVQPGVPIEIPAQADTPPAFILERTRPDQTALLVTVIVVPEPIAGINVHQEAQPLTDAQVSAWTREWGAHVERLDDLSSAGRAYTPAEKAAAGDAAKPLGAHDPLPLALFHSASPADGPILVSVPIKLARATKP